MNLLRFPNTNSYEVTESLYLESYGIYDKFYYVELVGMVFRCKILGVKDGILLTPMKNRTVVIEDIDLTEQDLLKQRFEDRQELIRLANYLLQFGFCCKTTGKYYPPDQIKVDIDSDSVSDEQGLILSELNVVDGMEQKKLLEDFRVKCFLDNSLDVMQMMEQYLINPANTNLMSDISSMAYKTCIFAAENLYPLYETDEQVSRVYTLIYSIWDIFKSYGSGVDQITEVLKDFIGLVANAPKLVQLVKASKKVLLLRDYYAFNRMYVNFYKRRSKEALVDAYKMIFEYVSLKKDNPILYQFLQKSQFAAKLENYFYSYLDKGRIVKYFVENKQVELNNEFKIIQVIDQRVQACSGIDLNLDSLVSKVKRIQNEFLS